tara:strand:+ start:785 stop:1138 length:354 start_codon:yes stop_codon:yes gene_type:complete
MSNETKNIKEHKPEVKEALRKATNEIVETLRGRYEAGSLNDHMDFLMGAASALHQLDMELWGGSDAKARCLPPVFCFAWRYKNAAEFLADWDKNDGYCYKNNKEIAPTFGDKNDPLI